MSKQMGQSNSCFISIKPSGSKDTVEQSFSFFLVSSCNSGVEIPGKSDHDIKGSLTLFDILTEEREIGNYGSLAGYQCLDLCVDAQICCCQVTLNRRLVYHKAICKYSQTSFTRTIWGPTNHSQEAPLISHRFSHLTHHTQKCR